MTLESFLAEWNSPSTTIHVHTSGSTGTPKDILAEKSRMLASARMTCDYLHLQPGDTALLCMPLDYIAGKMMVVRSLERQLQLVSVTPSSHPLEGIVRHVNFAAFVPLQVANSIDNPMLRHIDNIIIGGGAIDHDIERQLRSFPNNIYSSYGMTETLSHIALRRLSGTAASEWYTPLPGVTVSLNADRCLVVNAPHVCADTLTTNDIAELRPDGTFRILGRRDNVINSGGIKIQAEEVEQLLRQHLSADFLITSTPDPALGEAVTMLVRGVDVNAPSVISATALLPRYWKPRHIFTVDDLPITETGKPKRAEARKMALALLSDGKSEETA